MFFLGLMRFWGCLLKFESMIRYRGHRPAWNNIIYFSFVVEGAIRVLQAATLLEGDPDTRGSGGASNRARRSSKREGNSEEGGLAEHGCRLVRGES